MMYEKSLDNEKHKSYTKFIILYLNRSGSNLLHTLLDSHPAIMSMGEVLRLSVPLEKATCSYDLFSHNGGIAKAIKLRSKDPVSFLRRYIFQPRISEIKAVGFKAWIPNGHVMMYLRGINALKVIRLRRKNYLRMLASCVIAANSGAYTSIDSPKNIQNRDKSIILEYKDCVEWFNRWDRWNRLTQKMFYGHEKLEVFYEDFTERHEATTHRVLEFLDVYHRPLSSYLKKQNPEPLPDLVKNYWELKARFNDTKWSKFFIE